MGHFSLGFKEPHPNLVSPLKDNWLAKIPHHLPLLSKSEQSKPNTKLYTVGTDMKYRITTNINNIKQGTHDKCFNRHSIPKSLSLAPKIGLAKP